MSAATKSPFRCADPLHCAKSKMATTHLNVLNSGSASFEINYPSVDLSGVVPFPFAAAPFDELTVTGGGGVKGFNLERSATDLGGLLGKHVRLTYSQDIAASKHVVSVEGTLLRTDMSAVTLQLDEGKIMAVSPVRIVSIICTEATTASALVVSVTDPTKGISVRGTDGQFGFSTHHALMVEPDPESTDGTVLARLTSFAYVYNNYPDTDIEVSKLTLTEMATAAVDYERKAPRAALAVMSAPGAPQTASEQDGSMTLPGTVVLRRAQRTGLALGNRVLSDARLYQLATFNPLVEGQLTVPLDTILRMRSLADGANNFLFSGPVTVSVDMDPAPGDDHVSGPVVASIFYDRWTRSQSRLYHHLGETNLLRLCARDFEPEKAQHDERKNEHLVRTELSYSNRTPYPMLVKQYLKASMEQLISAVRVGKSDLMVQRLDDFVPEKEDDAVDKQVRTLTVVVPPHADELRVVLEIEYSLAR